MISPSDEVLDSSQHRLIQETPNQTGPHTGDRSGPRASLISQMLSPAKDKWKTGHDGEKVSICKSQKHILLFFHISFFRNVFK